MLFYGVDPAHINSCNLTQPHFANLHTALYKCTAYETHTFTLFFLSEFLAEESQEKFWDFVEANQNVEGEHDGKVTLPHSL